MAAIVTLSSLATTVFKSGVLLTDGAKTNSLRARLNTIITKVNEVIARYNLGTLDTLVIAGGSGTLYTGGAGAGVTADGVNPLTFDQFRIQDQDDGAYVTVTYNSLGGAHAVANFIVA